MNHSYFSFSPDVFHYCNSLLSSHGKHIISSCFFSFFLFISISLSLSFQHDSFKLFKCVLCLVLIHYHTFLPGLSSSRFLFLLSFSLSILSPFFSPLLCYNLSSLLESSPHFFSPVFSSSPHLFPCYRHLIISPLNPFLSHMGVRRLKVVMKSCPKTLRQPSDSDWQ